MTTHRHHLIRAVADATLGVGYEQVIGRPTAEDIAETVLLELASRCRNCGHPISPLATSANGWTHGRTDEGWQGIRCPRRLTGAAPMLEGNLLADVGQRGVRDERGTREGQGEVMRAQITLRNGKQIEVDVSDLTTGRNPDTGDLTVDLRELNTGVSAVIGELTNLQWTTPEQWTRKLHSIELSEIVAIVLIKELNPTVTPLRPDPDISEVITRT